MKESLFFKNVNLEIKEANTFFKKFIGLMFKRKKIDYLLLFKNTNGIHTFFMFQSIDVILFDKDFNVVRVYEEVKPWKIILPKRGVKHTLECPLGFLKNFKGELTLNKK